jgi:hypothetical protein
MRSNKPPNDRRKTLIFVAVYLAVLGVTGVFLLGELWFIWAALAVAGIIILGAYYRKTNPHKVLTVLVGLNIVLDALAILIWAAFPATQWSIYQLGFTTVGLEAAVAAALFTLTLFGLIKRQKWAPILAVAITITQRSFATYVFFPSTAIPVTTIWSVLIIYFAYRDITCKRDRGIQ